MNYRGTGSNPSWLRLGLIPGVSVFLLILLLLELLELLAAHSRAVRVLPMKTSRGVDGAGSAS